jgi:hypothetical protein
MRRPILLGIVLAAVAILTVGFIAAVWPSAESGIRAGAASGLVGPR